jgi:hypothetical protein
MNFLVRKDRPFRQDPLQHMVGIVLTYPDTLSQIVTFRSPAEFESVVFFQHDPGSELFPFPVQRLPEPLGIGF